MTREELKVHCIKQIQHCERWAEWHRKDPRSKIYEEHKLILELLEQESVLDKVRAEIEGMHRVILKDTPKDDWAVKWNQCLDEVLEIFDKYKTESLEQEPVREIKTVTNAKEAETYPISEDITKGFEEFTKMIFKQGRAESKE